MEVDSLHNSQINHKFDKMRKFYSSLLFWALLLTSCSHTAGIDNSEPENSEVCLSIDFESTTKGDMVESEEEMGTIGIYCAHTAALYWSESTIFDKMENKRLNYNSTTSDWEYVGDVPTWGHTTTTDKYTFYAYSPFSDSGDIISPSTDNGSLMIKFSVSEDCYSQPDLMMSTPRKDIYPQVGGSVSLNFKHTLAAVGFSVKGKAEEIIKKISIKNIITSGEVSINDSGEVIWSNLSDASKLEYSAGIDDTVAPDIYTQTQLTLENGYLMMIPQETTNIEVIAETYNTKTLESNEHTFYLKDSEDWQEGKCYNYTINISSYDYTIEGTSNCYLLHPNGSEQTFYIPVEGRINTFWRDYADDNQTYEDMLSSSDVWSTKILWYDVDQGISGFTTERVTSGFSPSESVTPFSAPDFTTVGTRSAMKITLPADIEEGNILVAVEFEGSILWSWHFWITDYNPDLIAQGCTADDNTYVYSIDNEEGEVHRYDNKDLWSTLYAGKFIMDRNLGARSTDYDKDKRGVLHYQFGRKDPFPYEASQDPTIENNRVSFAEAVQNPTTFYTQSDRPFSWSNEGLESSDQYLWDDKNVANDPNASGKSIFDPSPLGWRVPRNGTFTVLDNYNCPYVEDDDILLYMNSIKFPLTGHRSNSSGSAREYGNQGNIRLSTPIDSSFAYNFVYNPEVDKDTNNTRADGFCVRCIEE